MTVKRYRAVASAAISLYDSGEYVKYEDYAARQAQVNALAAENDELKKVFEKPQAYLSWHAIPPTWSDPGGGGEYLVVHDSPGHTNDDGSECWPIFPKPELETPATDAAIREIKAQGADIVLRALVTSDDDDFTDAPNICAAVARQLRNGERGGE